MWLYWVEPARFAAITSTADIFYGVDDEDDDGGVVNDGDGLAWLLAKDPQCVATLPEMAAQQCGDVNAAVQRKSNADLGLQCSALAWI